MSRKRRRTGRPSVDASTPVVSTARSSLRIPRVLFAAAFIALGFLAFGPALRAPFDFDDFDAITRNASIRQVWPPSVALRPPPRGTPVSGRPVVNYSFALNYAVNRWLGIAQSPATMAPNETIGYHIVNVLFHILAALLLAAIIRRTIRFGRVPDDWRDASDRIAVIAASIWMLHPIQTEAVDYVTQRTEIVASVFYLATLYAAIRAWQVERSGESDSNLRSRRMLSWSIAATVACLLGMASKEVMITAPIIVILYDRAFLASDWTTLWRTPARRRLYVGLLATSALSLALIASASWQERVGPEGGLAWYEYLYSQAWAIPHYVGLLLWPAGLTFDYGRHPVAGLGGIPGLIGLLAAGAATLAAWRRPQWQWFGFLGAWFFLILAPSSSFVSIATEIAAERRVYLAIAAVIVMLVVAIEQLRRWTLAEPDPRTTGTTAVRNVELGVLGAIVVAYFAASGWSAGRIFPDNDLARAVVRLSIGLMAASVVWCATFTRRQALRIAATTATACVLIAATFHRSAMYSDLRARWLDGIAKAPTNGRAYHNLASVELRTDPPKIAVADSLLRRAAAVDSFYIPAWVLRAKLAAAQDRLDDARSLLAHALRLRPLDAPATEELGIVLIAEKRPDLALPYLRQFAEVRPNGETLTRLGLAYLMTRQLDSALVVLERAVRVDSIEVEARRYLAAVLIERDRGAEALPYLEQAVRLDSTSGILFGLLSLADAQSGRGESAAQAASAAVVKAPNNPIVYIFVGRASQLIGRYSEAAAYFDQALRLSPDEPQALSRLGMAEAAMGHAAIARRLFERVLTRTPTYPLALQGLEQLRRGRLER